MENPVVHFEILGPDAPGLRAFYRKAFGWTTGESLPGAGVSDYALVEPIGAGAISGGIGASPDGYDGHATFYIRVSNIARALETINASGGSTMMGPEQVPNGPRIALFRDPGGHVVGLLEAEAA